jgi:hypothetical protein
MRQWISAAEFDADIARAVRETDEEIFDEATGTERDYNAGEFLDENSEVEGWDGESLGIEEVAHGNLFGRGDTNNDRPIEMQDMQALEAENQQLRAAIASLDKEINDYVRAAADRGAPAPGPRNHAS